MDPRERNRLKREKIEKNRQKFRLKVEQFYKEFYPDKWEIARDLLFCKYSVNFKEFNVKLIEKYGDAFKNYKHRDIAVKTAKELQADRVRKAAVLNGEIDDDVEIAEQQLIENNGLVPCTSCGRSFAQDRIVKHEDICVRQSEHKAEKKNISNNDTTVVPNVKQQQEKTIELNSDEQREIEELENQLRLLKMLKAQKQQAKK
jgi:hypothetical protein